MIWHIFVCAWKCIASWFGDVLNEGLGVYCVGLGMSLCVGLGMYIVWTWGCIVCRVVDVFRESLGMYCV